MKSTKEEEKKKTLEKKQKIKEKRIKDDTTFALLKREI